MYIQHNIVDMVPMLGYRKPPSLYGRSARFFDQNDGSILIIATRFKKFDLFVNRKCFGNI